MINIKLTKNVNQNYTNILSKLKVKKSFDLVSREINIGGRKAYLFFVDGFMKDEVAERILNKFISITKEEMNKVNNVTDFMSSYIAHIEADKENDIDKIVSGVLSGPMAIIIDGLDEAIMLDVRTYPARGPEEPQKEQSLKGSKDGFVETLVMNTALIRRRVRDENLVFEMMNVGNKSKTDVCIGYIEGLAKTDNIELIKKKIESIDVRALVMGDQSLVETLTKSKWYNPFPKIKTTQRPDVASAHVLEGKILILIDTSPNIIVVPVSIFDFMQEADDYYQPIITGNYLRFIRNLTLLITLILTPVYLLLIEYIDRLPVWIKFIEPEKGYAVPLIIQFLLLELAVDALKLASLNTPGALGMSLSVVGALILGDFAIKTEWFVPDTILYTAIVSLGGFAQTSIELGFAIKLCRMLLLVLTSLFKVWGFIIGLIITLILLATNKTIMGQSYIYPLYPFDGNALKHLLFRTPIKSNEKK
ncbi:spore germination protein [Terrisporobacter glycolicus]|uniref:Spore germination protein A1 n=1 Tax=Terrisporobacter glycolicus ATCC 14880 = DSM 1288 TaxID=1121315 RepID=A0ABZ2EW39_9FIRM|nr:spore germination protein [Terrisporobacter glycolicus]